MTTGMSLADFATYSGVPMRTLRKHADEIGVNVIGNRSYVTAEFVKAWDAKRVRIGKKQATPDDTGLTFEAAIRGL